MNRLFGENGAGKEEKDEKDDGTGNGQGRGEPVDKRLKPPFRPLVINLSLIIKVINYTWMHWNVNRFARKYALFSSALQME